MFGDTRRIAPSNPLGLNILALRMATDLAARLMATTIDGLFAQCRTFLSDCYAFPKIIRQIELFPALGASWNDPLTSAAQSNRRNMWLDRETGCGGCLAPGSEDSSERPSAQFAKLLPQPPRLAALASRCHDVNRRSALRIPALSGTPSGGLAGLNEVAELHRVLSRVPFRIAADTRLEPGRLSCPFGPAETGFRHLDNSITAA